MYTIITLNVNNNSFFMNDKINIDNDINTVSIYQLLYEIM